MHDMHGVIFINVRCSVSRFMLTERNRVDQEEID